MRRLLSLLPVVALALSAAPPAHAATTFTLAVAPTTSYAACTTVIGPASSYITVSFSTNGVQSRGLAAAEVADANTGAGWGYAHVCNLGGIVPTWGAVAYTVTYSTLKGSTGVLPVECTMLNGIFACSAKSAPSVAALD